LGGGGEDEEGSGGGACEEEGALGGGPGGVEEGRGQKGRQSTFAGVEGGGDREEGEDWEVDEEEEETLAEVILVGVPGTEV